ncbi:hypothetical protein FB446DRAFT_724802 [Lentinula raphanica]|nr:hypothetical protein FB446DRAFT_724802 [Lentinula raphanica]
MARALAAPRVPLVLLRRVCILKAKTSPRLLLPKAWTWVWMIPTPLWETVTLTQTAPRLLLPAPAVQAWVVRKHPRRAVQMVPRLLPPPMIQPSRVIRRVVPSLPTGNLPRAAVETHQTAARLQAQTAVAWEVPRT